MVNQRNRYSRARIRSKVRGARRRRSSSEWFYVAVAIVVIGGIAGIVLSRGDSSSAGEPPRPANPSTNQPGDHWHTAIAMNYCGTWITPPLEFHAVHDNPNVSAGIHTHGDGFIHTHPNTRSEGGDNATLGRFLDYGGWSASETSLHTWEHVASLTAAPVEIDVENGDKCPAGFPYAGRTGVVKWSLDCKDQEGDPSDVRLRDGEVVALAFIPKSEAIGTPPNASSTPSNDGSAAAPLDVASCSTSGPGGDTTTTTASTPVTSTPPQS